MNPDLLSLEEELPRLSQAGLLSLRQLSYLVVLSQTLNFTQAAERCFVTQSTLSSGIQELERLLGAQLVERSRQKVHLTALGLEVVARAKELVLHASDLVNLVRDRTRPLSGIVKFGIIPTIAPYMIAPLLGGISARAPELELTFHEDQTSALIKGVKDGWLDCALIALPMEVGNLHVQTLFHEDFWLIAPRSHPLMGARKVALEQINQYRLVVLSDGHCLRDHTLQSCGHGRRGRTLQEALVDAQSLPTLVEMVNAGLGIALLPTMCLASALHLKETLTTKTIEAAPRRDIALVSRSTEVRQDILALLTEILKNTKRSAPSA